MPFSSYRARHYCRPPWPGREEDAVDQMLEFAPRAAPNLLVLKLADQVLERDGRLQAAWLDRYENGEAIERLRWFKREIYERRMRGMDL